jgi:hypothetical protein
VSIQALRRDALWLVAASSSDGTFKFDEARDQESDDAFVIQKVWYVCTIESSELTKHVSQEFHVLAGSRVLYFPHI